MKVPHLSLPLNDFRNDYDKCNKVLLFCSFLRKPKSLSFESYTTFNYDGAAAQLQETSHGNWRLVGNGSSFDWSASNRNPFSSSVP